MLSKTTWIKRLLSPVTFLLLVVLCVFSRLIDMEMLSLISHFSHQIKGLDILVTMLVIGIWSAQLRGSATWLLPLTFISVMSLSGVFGAGRYLTVSTAQILILLSCLIFSALIIRKIRFTTQINVMMVAAFAFFHGTAHGQEISASASLVFYALGFMAATLLLHGTSILLARLIFIVAAFFIAQTLNVTQFTDSPYSQIQSTSTSIELGNTFVEQTNYQEHTIVSKRTEKISLINSPQGSIDQASLLEPILQFTTSTKTYFVLCALLLVFYISQFICYVFYPKQRLNVVLLLTRRFINSLYSNVLPSTLSRSNQFFFFNSNSKRIFMSIRLPKILALFSLLPFRVCYAFC